MTFERARVWWLSSGDLAGLRFYCKLKSCRRVVEHILKDHELFDLFSFKNPRKLPQRKAPPPTLADATPELVDLLADPEKRTAKARELANLRKTYRKRADTNLF